MYRKAPFVMVAPVVLSIVLGCALGPKDEEREPVTFGAQISYEKLSMDSLIAKSDLIVIGELSRIHPSRWNTTDGNRPEMDPTGGYPRGSLIFTDMDFGVDRFLKGENQAMEVRIRSLGGEVDGDRMIVSGTYPIMNRSYLLFLALDTTGSTAKIGPEHHWITGGPQGIYEISGGQAVSGTGEEWLLEELISRIEESVRTQP